MYFVAFLLALATGAYYMAGNDGVLSDPLCTYGPIFCQHPSWLGAATVLALVWAAFVSVR